MRSLDARTCGRRLSVSVGYPTQSAPAKARLSVNVVAMGYESKAIQLYCLSNPKISKKGDADLALVNV